MSQIVLKHTLVWLHISPPPAFFPQHVYAVEASGMAEHARNVIAEPRDPYGRIRPDSAPRLLNPKVVSQLAVCHKCWLLNALNAQCRCSRNQNHEQANPIPPPDGLVLPARR